MMTGNLIKGTCALVDARFADARFFAAMIVSYLAGCSGQRILDQRATPRTKSRVIAVATFLLFRCSDVFGGASARRGALWLAAGFGLVNAVSVDVLLTITWMLTIHMQKLTNYATDAIGLSGAKAKASAKFGPVLRRSCVVLALFAAGVGAGPCPPRAGRRPRVCLSHPNFPSDGGCISFGSGSSLRSNARHALCGR